MTWARQSASVYIGNATAVRDYRVQLRGNRAVILWAFYLAILIGFGMLTYSDAARQGSMSVVEAQSSLKRFYDSVMGLLAGMLALIAPALTATAIIAERQRKSLDLVFSAPVAPRYYLVGKLISSYRYVWMLLVLSLPVTAACVVLGGATWSEVLVSYGLMSLHGLIYTSIGLFFSALAQRPVGAIVWSYVTVFFVYWPIVGYVGVIPEVTYSFLGPRGGSINELPFMVCLSPFQIQQAAASYTVIAGYHVPNWILTTIVVLLVSRMLLLGAASVLSPYGSIETKSLRVYGLFYAGALALATAACLGATQATTTVITGSTVGPGGYAGPSPADVELGYARLFVAMLLPLIVVLPFLSTYGTDLEKKFWPDGAFRVRRTIMGTPSGGLPYLLLLGLFILFGELLYGFWQPNGFGGRTAIYAFYGLSLMFMFWSVGRLTSALNNGLRYARTLQFTAIVLILALPLPFLSIANPFGFSSTDPNIWDLYLLRPLFSLGDRSAHALIFGTVFIVVGLAITRWSEMLAKARYARVGLNYE